MIVGMNRRLASEWRASDLAAAVRDHFVNIHIELGAAAGHPHVEGEHVVMLAGEDFVADLHNQIVALLIEALAGKVCIGGAFLQNRIGRDHFAGNQILPNAEVFERTLGLCTPELVGGNIYLAETIGFFANVWHPILLFDWQLYRNMQFGSSDLCSSVCRQGISVLIN